MSQSNIYVASSWRCSRQPLVVEALRADGHQVYDFRHPTADSAGFSWHELDPTIPRGPANLDLPAHMIRRMLAHPVAGHGFEQDMGALRACDICVLVLPCGRSAHLEAGWAAGAGKLLVVLLDDGEPDLMWKMADILCVNVAELRAVCSRWRRPVAA
jgi:hypothetical protein